MMPDCRGKHRGGHWRKGRKQEAGKKLLGQEPSVVLREKQGKAG